MPQKEIITKELLHYIDEGILSKDLPDLITTLQQFQADYPGYTLQLNVDSGHENINLSLIGSRFETDEEYKKRVGSTIERRKRELKKTIKKAKDVMTNAKKELDELKEF